MARSAQRWARRYLDQLSDNWSEATGELAELPSSTSSEAVTKLAGRRGSR